MKTVTIMALIFSLTALPLAAAQQGHREIDIRFAASAKKLTQTPLWDAKENDAKKSKEKPKGPGLKFWVSDVKEHKENKENDCDNKETVALECPSSPLQSVDTLVPLKQRLKKKQGDMYRVALLD